MNDHDERIEEARALAGEKEYAQAAELLEAHIAEPACAIAYADIAQRHGLGEEVYQRAHHALRNTRHPNRETQLISGLYDALSLFDGAKPMQGIGSLGSADVMGENAVKVGPIKVLDRWASALALREVEDRSAWAASLKPLVRSYPHLAMFMAAIINTNRSPASGGNEARDDEDPDRIFSLYAPTVFPIELKPLLKEITQMQRWCNGLHWLGATLGIRSTSAKALIRLYKAIYGAKVHGGGYSIVVLPDGAGEIMFGYEENCVDFIAYRIPLDDKRPLHEQFIHTLWSGHDRFDPLLCGPWKKERENWQEMRAAAICGNEALDCRFEYWTGSKAGAEKNPNMMWINWVDTASAVPWREELEAIIEESSLKLQHAGLPSAKRRKGLLPLYKKIKTLLEKHEYEKTSAWLIDYAKSNPDEPGGNFADGLMEKMADEFPDPNEDGDTLCHVRFDGEIIEDDDAYASLLEWYFEAARKQVAQPKIKSSYDSKTCMETATFTHRGTKRDMTYSHKSDWVSEKFMKEARQIVSEDCDWRYVALGGDDFNLQVFMPNELADLLVATFYELVD